MYSNGESPKTQSPQYPVGCPSIFGSLSLAPHATFRVFSTGVSCSGAILRIKNIFRIIRNIKTLQKLKIFLPERPARMMCLLIFNIIDDRRLRRFHYYTPVAPLGLRFGVKATCFSVFDICLIDLSKSSKIWKNTLTFNRHSSIITVARDKIRLHAV